MAVSAAGSYVIHHSASVSTAITILQVQAPATRPLEIIRAWCTQSSSTTSAQMSIALLRKSVAATVTAAVAADIAGLDPTRNASNVQLGTAGTGYIATVEGTDGAYVDDTGFNVLNGYLYLPVPEERVIVPAGGLIALKFTTAPAAATTFRYGLTWDEIG